MKPCACSIFTNLLIAILACYKYILSFSRCENFKMAGRPAFGKIKVTDLGLRVDLTASTDLSPEYTFNM